MIVYSSGNKVIAYFAKRIASRRGEATLALPEKEEAAGVSVPENESAVFVLSLQGKRLKEVVEDLFKRVRLVKGQGVYFTLLGGSTIYPLGKLLAEICGHRNLRFKGIEMVRMPAVA